MKRLALMILCLTLCMAGAVAEEEFVSSPLLNIEITQILPVDEQELPEGFIIVKEELADASEIIIDTYEQIKADVSENKAVLEIITFETVEGEELVLPEGFEEMTITEFVSLATSGYTVEIGDVLLMLKTPGDYTNVQLASVLGVWDGEKMVWNLVETGFDVELEEISVELTSELLEQMNENEVVLLILRKEISL